MLYWVGSKKCIYIFVNLSLKKAKVARKENLNCVTKLLHKRPQCNTSFSQVKMLMLTHDEEIQVKCTQCDFSTTTDQALSNHMISHLDKKRYACAECKKSFSSARYLRKHIFTHKCLSLTNVYSVAPHSDKQPI